MADIITKAKLQLRVGNGEKVPMSPTKLLINHGKPNFTIQRSTSRVQENGEVSPLSSLNQANNNSNNNNNNNNNDNSSNKSIKNNINHSNINNADNKSHSSNTNNNNNNNNNNNTNTNTIYNNNERTTNGSNTVNGNVNNNVKTAVNGNVIVNSNKFNGMLKSTTKPLATKEATHQRDDSTENEAARVVLRRTTIRRTPELLAPKEDDVDAVPEFIRRQRRIQERLAKENVLDFENRRSGYFTHVLISPTSPSRTSFVETMSSPAIVPSLEMAAPSPPTAPKRESEELAKASLSENKKDEQTVMVEKAEKMEQTNGHVKEEKTIYEEGKEEEEQKNEKEVPMNGSTEELKEQKLPNVNKEEQKNQKVEVETETKIGAMEEAKKHEEVEQRVQTIEPAEDHKEKKQEDEHTKGQTAEQVAEAEVAKAIEEVNKAVAGEDDVADEFTVSHTNEMHQTSVHTVEPISTVVVENVNGRNVVNIELPEQTPAHDVDTSVQHKTEAVLANQPIVVGAEAVVIKVNHTSNGTDAISEKLNADEANNNELKSTDAADAELQTLAQLKFEIKGEDAESVVVTPVLRTE